MADNSEQKLNGFDLAHLGKAPKSPERYGPPDEPDKVPPAATKSKAIGTGNPLNEAFKDKSIIKGMKECQDGKNADATMIDSGTCLDVNGGSLRIRALLGGKKNR